MNNSKKKKILLHVCCAPCSTYPITVLREEFDVTAYFYNPNIHPKKEWLFRRDELVEFLDRWKVPLFLDQYDAAAWFRLTKGYEKEPEGGKRCSICFDMRLKRAALYAASNGFDLFTTTLSVSPHKNAELINSLGEKAGKKFLFALWDIEGHGSKEVYLASKKLQLETEASIRFSHQLSPQLPLIGMTRLIQLVLKYFPKAKIVEFYDFYQKPSRKIILFDFEKYKNYLGEEVSKKEAKEIFKRMGANLVKETKQGIFIEPPKERIDLNLDIDLFEEIARVIGYQKLKPTPPLALIFPKRPKDEIVFEEKIRDIFISMGFDEVYNYSMKKGKQEEIGNENWKEIKILNPTSQEFEYLRSDLIYGFLKNVSLNFKFFKDLKIFEIGKIFYQKNNKFFEEKHFGTGLPG